MTRYTYSEENNTREKELAAIVKKEKNCECDLQLKYSIFDAVAYKLKTRKPQAFIEMRVVNYAFGDLPEIMIPMSKIILGQQQTQLTGVKSLFMVFWYKCKSVTYVDINNIECKPDYRVTPKGMNRTNDPNEIEVCRYVPSEVFKVMVDNRFAEFPVA
tara:strand:- start:66 stop:539 length:474 start_codon:yes stop_codon:yes gene_type:complete